MRRTPACGCETRPDGRESCARTLSARPQRARSTGARVWRIALVPFPVPASNPFISSVANGSRGSAIRTGDESSSALPFDAQYLLQRVQRFDEVALVFHDLVDRLVGAGNLIDHALVLAADHAPGLFHEVPRRVRFLRLRAAHAAARAVRAGLEALLRTFAAHDVGLRSHAAGDDAQVALARADRPLARHPHILAVVVLTLDVVM